VDTKPVYTPWAHEVDWHGFKRELKAFYKTYLTEALYEEYMDYYRTKRDFHLSPFDPKIHVTQIFKYGYNDGLWNSRVLKVWTDEIDQMMKQFHWDSNNLYSIPRDIDNWDDLIMTAPMFGLIRHDATSGYPDFVPQSEKYVLENYGPAITRGPHGIVVAYHRRHGYSLKESDLGHKELIEKDRFVGGVGFPSKVSGLPLTWSFKLTMPDWSAYYTDWNTLFSWIIDNLIENADGFIFTTDQSGFDQRHNSFVLKQAFYHMLKDAPSDIRKATLNVMNADYNDPDIMLNAMYTLKLGRWLSVSGSPPTPLIETLVNSGNHKAILDMMDVGIRKRKIQIDDSIYFVDNAFDLEEFSKNMRKEIGFITNPTKTESMTYKKYITYLQVNAGELYHELPSFVNNFYDKGIYILGYGPRRDHRLQFRERMNAYGDLIFAYKDIDTPVDVDVQRMIGSLSSYGPMMPEELWNIHVKYLSPTEVFNKAVAYAKSNWIAAVDEWGFSPEWVLKELSSL
jgi:hypothetical protein